VLVALRDDPGLSIRKAAAMAGASINIVRQVAVAVGRVFA
jgi:hypothetical protein